MANANTVAAEVVEMATRRTEAHEGAAKVFWDRVQKTKRCWWFLGTKPGQYGAFSFQGTRFAAHRYSYELQNGPIPCGLFILHRCDNPSCVRPEHLFAGTNLENIQDAITKGRKTGPTTPVDDDFGVESHLPLTRRQLELLVIIEQAIAQDGMAPTLAEMADALGVSSLATVHKHLEGLHRRGRLRREWNRSRASTPTGGCPMCGQSRPIITEAA